MSRVRPLVLSWSWLLLAPLAFPAGDPAADAGTPVAREAPTRSTPPSGETPEVARRVDAVARALAAGGLSTSDALLDRAWLDLHPYPRFREAIRDAADARPLAVARADEPGTRLAIEARVEDASGAPVAGALVYLYQTSAEGWYASDGVHVAGNSGDARHARLFGYVRTDANGRFTVSTVRPGSYPGGDLPAHVHVAIRPRGADAARVTEIQFDDDPKLTPEWRERARLAGCIVAAVERDERGAQTVRPRIVLP